MSKSLVIAAALGLMASTSANPFPAPTTAAVPSCTEYRNPVRPTPEYYEYTKAEAEASAELAEMVKDYETPEIQPPNPTRYATPLGITDPSCTVRDQIDPVVPDSTSTIYRSTVTSTTYTECGECVLEWSTGVLYFFAPIFNTATVTWPDPSTAWDLACATPTEETYASPQLESGPY